MNSLGRATLQVGYCLFALIEEQGQRIDWNLVINACTIREIV